MLKAREPISSSSITEGDGAARRRQGLAAVIGIATVILILGGVTLNGLRHLDASRRMVDHTQSVLQRAENVRAELVDAETGERGYVIVGEKEYLEPYHRALASLGSDTSALRRLTVDDRIQQARLNKLNELVGARLDRLRQGIAVREASGLAAAQEFVRTSHGKIFMDSARASLNEIESAERQLLASRSAREADYAAKVNAIVIVGSLIAMILALMLARMLTASAEQEAATARDMAHQNEQLEEQALEMELQQRQLEEQTEELTAQNEEMRTTTEELVLQTDLLQSARITAEKAQAAAEDANKAKLQFLATMSHELRTPLNAITGYADLLAIGVRGPVTAAQIDDLQRIKRGSQTLLSHINDILNFAKLEAGKIEFRPSIVPVGDLITSAESLVRPQMLSKSIQFRNECADGFSVLGDRDKIEQILLNLLSNAQKFTNPGGEISMTCEAVGETVRISVRDTGLGIPADRIEAIFEPFVQVNRQLTSDIHHGVGLGLAISRELARGMGGDIVATSAPGEGSVFTIVLPLA